MPRTVLLSRLRSIAARLQAVQTRALLPTAAGEAPLSRRRLVQAAAIGAAAAALGERALAGSKKKAQQEIAIVGAGLAGLVAARELKQAGLAPPIFEASSWTGGRVITDHATFAASGQRVERGGELIDSGHKRLRKLVKQLGLKLDDLLASEPAGTEMLALFGGQVYTFAEAEHDFAALYPALHQDVVKAKFPTTYDGYTQHGFELDQLSIVDWIESRVPGGMASQLGQLLATAYDIEYGALPTEQSSLNLVYLLGFGATPNNFALFGESDERFRVQGGNDQVAALLAQDVAPQLRLGHRLEAAATLPDGRTRLTFATDAGVIEQAFDRVILTVPFAVLRASVDIAGLALQPLKRTSIEQQGMGTNVKLHVQFADRHWYGLGCNGETFGDTGFQNTWEETRAQPGVQGILNDYLGSKGPGLAGLAPAAAAAQFLLQIEPLLAGLSAKWKGLASVDYWPGSPFQKGSYSYWKVGQYTGFAGVEREPEGGVFFAGEHTSVEFQGYMEGAVESGERAAGELLASI